MSHLFVVDQPLIPYRDDFCYADTGELAGPGRTVCSHGWAGDECGCRRVLDGVRTRRGSTTFRIERDGGRLRELVADGVISRLEASWIRREANKWELGARLRVRDGCIYRDSEVNAALVAAIEDAGLSLGTPLWLLTDGRRSGPSEWISRTHDGDYVAMSRPAGQSIASGGPRLGLTGLGHHVIQQGAWGVRDQAEWTLPKFVYPLDPYSGVFCTEELLDGESATGVRRLAWEEDGSLEVFGPTPPDWDPDHGTVHWRTVQLVKLALEMPCVLSVPAGYEADAPFDGVWRVTRSPDLDDIIN